MDAELRFARALAKEAGRIIKANFASNLTIELKPDHSPVTQVDKEINDLVIQSVRETYPDHGVLGEEANAGSGQEAYQWLCDPLDGTAAFIIGMQHTTFILALLKDGEIMLSVVYDPFTDRLYHAVRGEGAFCNDAKIQVSNQPLRDGYVLIEQSAFGVYQNILDAGAITEPVAGAGYRAMLLAGGRCCAIVQGKADNHDVGPSSLIIEEAGGMVTRYDGSRPRYDRPIVGGVVLSNGVCHEQLLEVINHA